MKVFIHLPFGLDADKYRARFDAGLEPDQSPYGFHNAAKLGYEVQFSKSVCGTGVQRVVFRLFSKLLGRDILHVWFNRAGIKDAEVVWTLLENEAIAVGLLMSLRVIAKRPLLASAVWMMDKWSTIPALRRAIIKQSSRCWSTLLIQSAPSLALAKLVLPKVNSELMLFGISSTTFKPISYDPDVRPIHIVAAGNDKTRDWKTLLEAFGNQPGIKLSIICKWLAEDLDQYDNVERLLLTNNQQLLDVYKSATVMAIPMNENIFSGITVALEAASMGIPVICSDTGGVSTYFDATEVKYVAPKNALALRNALADLDHEKLVKMAARAQARFRSDKYSTLGMVARYSQISKRILRPGQASSDPV